MRRLTAIGFIWFGCAVAWMILGSTLLMRTSDSATTMSTELVGLWGPPLEQAPPRAVYTITRPRSEKVTVTDATGHLVEKETIREEDVEMTLPLERTDGAVSLHLEHRKKGLVWFATYAVNFHADYDFVNDSGIDRTIDVRFPLAADQAIFDGFIVRDAGGAELSAKVDKGVAQWRAIFRAGERRRFSVRYASRGSDRWLYLCAANSGQVRDFHLAVDTDFGAVDFPPASLAPTAHALTAGGWHGEWTFASLVASQSLGIVPPEKLNPGPLASKITFFAPVGLLFFFFVVAVLAAAQRRRIHPLNYFFLGCAFFAFHLLFAYLVDHVAVGSAFALSSLVSLVLVVSYARLFVGWRFALRELALAQLIYLVLFSFTFFWAGFTGLAITLGAIVTLFVMMQVTGRVEWEEEPT
jgi:hypothetical protein